MRLGQGKVFPLQKIKHVVASHVLHNDVVVLTVFEEVDQSDNVVVLTHLQHFDFSALLSDLDGRHLIFLHSLDGNLVRINFVACKLNDAKLSFSELFNYFVELKHILLIGSLLERLAKIF